MRQADLRDDANYGKKVTSEFRLGTEIKHPQEIESSVKESVREDIRKKARAEELGKYKQKLKSEIEDEWKEKTPGAASQHHFWKPMVGLVKQEVELELSRRSERRCELRSGLKSWRSARKTFEQKCKKNGSWRYELSRRRKLKVSMPNVLRLLIMSINGYPLLLRVTKSDTFT